MEAISHCMWFVGMDANAADVVAIPFDWASDVKWTLLWTLAALHRGFAGDTSGSLEDLMKRKGFQLSSSVNELIQVGHTDTRLRTHVGIRNDTCEPQRRTCHDDKSESESRKPRPSNEHNCHYEENTRIFRSGAPSALIQVRLPDTAVNA